ncbi:hypothetical protein [Legionella longbeachae]|uniref:hypothetical protein n=1 Tax=Legionella longbeachae TaxID=450 RepID=UPI000F73C647|nr:hypothetical protein [Legionella longbeachae]HBD7397954.1 hypothetical protein [Legionella pneumophila]QED10771.1 hypothetical protein B0B39_19030 [Legionella longbeachae]QEY51780.1 hypothetical protein FQU71_11325 [Legionella longbeachae]QIN32522.1 hypothetical protein GCB94_10395 [Legionella longbeachae]RZV21062.1 hypothetical protein EKG34_17495 [Legionella longbeachae]
MRHSASSVTLSQVQAINLLASKLMQQYSQTKASNIKAWTNNWTQLTDAHLFPEFFLNGVIIMVLFTLFTSATK